MEYNKPTIICLTPIKNEDWILERFLQSASLWADYIIIADQESTDNSRDIISKYPKARVINNPTNIPNEPERQRLLINAAREIPGPKLFLALDADEVLSPEAFSPESWAPLFECQPGTIFRFQWASFLPGIKQFWQGYFLPFGYYDDGIDHTNSSFFHGTRLPHPENHPVVDISTFKFIHFQYIDPVRNEHKQRWYQCLELDHNSIASDAIGIYRKYHQNFTPSPERVFDIPAQWFDEYKAKGIDISTVPESTRYWYDDETQKLFTQYGFKHYKKLDIWTDLFEKNDPRNLLDKMVHLWLRKSQPHYYSKARAIDNWIKRVIHY